MKKTNQSSFSKKLSSYATLASAFLAFGPGAVAQCGTADAANPILDIDINGDGILDVSLNWNSSSSFGPINTTGANYVGDITNTGTRFFSYYTYGLTPPPYSTIVGGTYCYIAQVPGGTMGGGPNGSQYGVPGIGNFSFYFAGTATGIVNYSNQYFGVSSIYLFFSNTYIKNSAYAAANPGNQIIGLTNGSSNVCAQACLGGSNVPLGYNSNQNFSGVVVYYANQGVNFQTSGTLYAPFPYAASYSCSVGNGLYPGIPNVPFNVSFNFVTTGPVQFSNSGPGTRCLIANTNPTNYLAVKFKGPDADGDGLPDTYNGWVEISIDPKTSAITCVGTGYNQCSIESANQVNGTADACPSGADLVIGTTVTGLCNACDADNGALSITIKK